MATLSSFKRSYAAIVCQAATIRKPVQVTIMREPGTVRHLGILDRMKSYTESKSEEAKEKVKEKLFQQQMEFMTASPSYTLGDHVKLYETIAEKSGANGWRKMLLTEAQKADLAEQLVDLKIGAELTDAERADPRMIDGKVKARLMAAVGCDSERVNRFMENYQQSARIHGWLVIRKARNAAIPSNMTEFIHCMMADKVHFQQGQKSQGAKKTPGRVKAQMRRL